MGAGRNREERGRQRPALDLMGAPGYQYFSLLRSDSSFSDIYTTTPNLDPRVSEPRCPGWLGTFWACSLGQRSVHPGPH